MTNRGSSVSLLRSERGFEDGVRVCGFEAVPAQALGDVRAAVAAASPAIGSRSTNSACDAAAARRRVASTPATPRGSPSSVFDMNPNSSTSATPRRRKPRSGEPCRGGARARRLRRERRRLRNARHASRDANRRRGGESRDALSRSNATNLAPPPRREFSACPCTSVQAAYSARSSRFRTRRLSRKNRAPERRRVRAPPTRAPPRSATSYGKATSVRVGGVTAILDALDASLDHLPGVVGQVVDAQRRLTNSLGKAGRSSERDGGPNPRRFRRLRLHRLLAAAYGVRQRLSFFLRILRDLRLRRSGSEQRVHRAFRARGFRARYGRTYASIWAVRHDAARGPRGSSRGAPRRAYRLRGNAFLAEGPAKMCSDAATVTPATFVSWCSARIRPPPRARMRPWRRARTSRPTRPCGSRARREWPRDHARSRDLMIDCFGYCTYID